MINTMLIGVGPHANRIYLPFIRKFGPKHGLNLVAGVECEGNENRTSGFLELNSIKIKDLIFVKKFADPMPKDVEEKLNIVVNKLNITAVIIATEPSSHKAYAIWALKRRLHVLMDKPITTRENASTDLKQAKGILDDFMAITAVAKNSGTHCVVNSQRRYHPGKQKVYSLIKEIAEQFNMPITAMHSSDSDGQWFFPAEIINQPYHGYNRGNGKCSHSGYHYFDTIYNFYKCGMPVKKQADTVEVYSSFLKPPGFFKQITQDDYYNWFGQGYQKEYSDVELNKLVSNYGEIDAFSLVSFYRDGHNICTVTLDLMHNSFCRRAWVKANKDLYKHNGRVKHEYHLIQQGPLQSIQIHGYQADSEHDCNNQDDFDLGGNNHYEINVFRNSQLIGGKPLERFSTRSFKEGIKEIDANIPIEQLTYEYSRELAISEFCNLINGKLTLSSSPIEDHLFPVQLMSSIYMSHILHQSIKFEIH